MNEEMYALMQKGICPVCKIKIKKHSKWKRGYCLNKVMDEKGIASRKIIKDDGSIETVKFFPASLNGWDKK